MMETLINIEKATHNELIDEYNIMAGDIWSKYSCDCLGFYVHALHKKISEHKLGFKKEITWKV